MNENIQESIDRQRRILKDWLAASLIRIAEDCRQLWPDRQALEARLMEGLTELPYCKYLYLLDGQAHQITANASRLSNVTFNVSVIAAPHASGICS